MSVRLGMKSSGGARAEPGARVAFARKGAPPRPKSVRSRAPSEILDGRTRLGRSESSLGRAPSQNFGIAPYGPAMLDAPERVSDDVPLTTRRYRQREGYMDRITSGLLSEFCSEFSLSSFAEDKQFEIFATYVTVRRHFSESTFDPSTLITGAGGDTGIDGIAIIVNNSLVGEIDDVDELLKINGYIDATFVFVQAERTGGFDSAKIGTFGFGVRDFFGAGTLVRNDKIKKFHAIANAVFERSAKFTRGNPSVAMYYVTTGKWVNDQNLTARYKSEINYLSETGNFSEVAFVHVGADLLQRYYNQTKNAITREFVFERKTVIPNINGMQRRVYRFPISYRLSPHNN